jgi:hypothetical protein
MYFHHHHHGKYFIIRTWSSCFTMLCANHPLLHTISSMWLALRHYHYLPTPNIELSPVSAHWPDSALTTERIRSQCPVTPRTPRVSIVWNYSLGANGSQRTHYRLRTRLTDQLTGLTSLQCSVQSREVLERVFADQTRPVHPDQTRSTSSPSAAHVAC